MKATLLATALALCAASASAQTIYTTVSFDGHKTFSDRAGPMPATVLEPAPVSEVPKAPGARFLVSPQLSATVDAREAERRLEQAQRKRSKEMAPQSGESDKIPGGIIVNARYWERQKSLDLEVEQAQRRSNETQRLQITSQ